MNRVQFQSSASRSLRCLITFLLLVGQHSMLRAQPPAAGTAGAVIFGAQAVLDKLNNILVSLTGDASIAVGGASQQFSDLINEANGLAKDNFATPINNLSSNIRVVINRLQEVTEAFDALASKQRECIFERLDLFVSGVQTVASGIKVLGLPVVTTAPRLISFTFDGQITPNVVPKAGGTARVSGVSVWTASSVPPTVQLKSSDNTVLGTLTPQLGSSVNDFRVPIAAALFSGRAGQCLYFDVTSYKKSLFGKKKTGEMTLPICVPREFERSVSIQANVAYSVTAQAPERAISGRRFEFANTSCEDRKNVSHGEAWDAEIPAGWRIVRLQQSAPDIVNQSNIGVSSSTKAITAAGWLDTASCIKTPFSATLLHDTHWKMTLTPVIDGPNTTNLTSSGSSQPMAMNYPTTSNICASVPKDSGASGPSSFWITLTPYLRGEQLSSALYVGPRQTDPTTDTFTYSDTDTTGAYQINVSYNPTVVNGNSQVCASLTAKGTCAW
jgi:hypothetical protein